MPVLVFLIISFAHYQLGILKDIVPDDGVLAKVKLAVVLEHVSWWEVEATAASASNRFARVQGTLSPVTVELTEVHVDNATDMGKVAADSKLTNVCPNKFGCWSDVFFAYFVAVNWTGGSAVHWRGKPSPNAILAKQMTALNNLVCRLENTKTNATDDFIVNFALETVQIVAHVCKRTS